MPIPSYDEIVKWFASYGFTQDNIAPFLVFTIVLYISIRKLVNPQFDKLKDRLDKVEKCVIEMQTAMRAKLKVDLQQTISSKYGVSNSPMVLNAAYREFITAPKIDEQVESKKEELLKWLNAQKPKTGLDAQDDIGELVITNKIAEFLDLDEYRQNLYRKGKTSQDAIGILAVYLFQILIPELGLPDGEDKKAK